MIDVSALVKAAEAEAAAWDRGEGLPREMVALAAEAGVLAADRAPEHGGRGADAHELGALAARLGEADTGLRALLTVSGMVGAAVARWGTAEQRATWLPRMASGELLAGFASTEPGAGSDLSAVATLVEPHGSDHRITGRKLWVTFGELADVVLLLGRSPRGLVAVLVETDAPGVGVEPVRDPLGMRGSRLAHLTFDQVTVPASHLVAPPGFGLSHVVGTALDHGRFTVAWGSAGMARACLADAGAHVTSRSQNGTLLSEHQMVRAALGRAHVETRGAFALCEEAARHRAQGQPQTILSAVVAKYAASRAAASVSQQAVQLHGASGCAPDSRVGRFYRDAKIMQIIEGADDVAELNIGAQVLSEYTEGAAG
jgi:acyl-CoA dehydrogenase